MLGRLLALVLVLGVSSCAIDPRFQTTVFEGAGDTVVVVHGLRWRVFGDMEWMARRFNRAGYRVVLVRYPAHEFDGERIAHDFLAKAVASENIRRDRPLHFVAHSLGAVITHRLLQDHAPSNLGRCVFIAAPHRGTELADIVCRRMPWTLRLIGPAAASLHTDAGGLPSTLRPPLFAVGAIVGDRSNYPFLSPFVPGADDGVVSVRSASVAGARDVLVLHEAHVEMIRSPEVFRQARHFIETGAFDHSKPSPRPSRIALGRPGGLK